MTTAPRRPTLEGKIVFDRWFALKLIVGACFVVFGVTFLALEYRIAFVAKQSPHWTHIGGYFGAAILGLCIPFWPIVFPVAQKISVFIFPNGLPIVGGRRASDPPAPPGKDGAP